MQKGLGKYSKKDSTFKLGYWENSQITTTIVDVLEIALKLKEIDDLVEETLRKVEGSIENLRSTYKHYIPTVNLDSLLEYK